MSGTVCIPNIGPLQRRRRRRLALLLFLAACGLGVVLLSLDVPRLLRTIIFLPVIGSALGLFQARAQTCVALAARNQRNMDGGNQTVTDSGELALIRQQARRVNLQSIALALIVTAAFVAL